MTRAGGPLGGLLDEIEETAQRAPAAGSWSWRDAADRRAAAGHDLVHVTDEEEASTTAPGVGSAAGACSSPVLRFDVRNAPFPRAVTR